MKFRSYLACVYDGERERAFSVCGHKEENTYICELSSTGEKTLVVSGRTNVYDKIQSFADSCDLKSIISNIVREQGVPVLSQDSLNKVLDFVNAPTDIGDYLNTLKDGQTVFDSLPKEIKHVYDNNLQKFVSDFGTDNFNNVLQEYIDSQRLVLNPPSDPAEPSPNPEPNDPNGGVE